ncbi:hypothetical protein FISHEDRAFT_74587 [Fistulina hepatica ATCC 64428]|uniref:GOLD domain-containing protein n=1 Tax=Fistulina hepatica ATCC 64428 TaxID=1128425 RepID=A0A0D7AC18_9AGAR|nr:hypothetical protein FISHEDRAFT_74587 [Fistulina hepatica ATCC 64428]
MHFLSLFALLLAFPVYAVKFNLQGYRFPQPKCIWNAAYAEQLVIVTANVAAGDPRQRVDIEIVDSSPQRNIYLKKKDIKGETRLAITTHAEGEVGVCFKNTLSKDVPYDGLDRNNLTKTIDLDVDIGADAVDYNAIANQESLSALETEMRKLEGIVKEVVDEMAYLKQREEKFAGTNESTNQRVQNFAWFTLASLTGLGIWQVVHLRAFFKRKYLID